MIRHLFIHLPFYVPGLSATLFGWTLLLPGDTFGSSRAFAAMATFATETHWGLFLVIAGSVQLIAAMFSKRVAIGLLLPLIGAFVFVSMSCLTSSDTPSPGAAQYGLMSLIAIWAFVRWGARWQT